MSRLLDPKKGQRRQKYEFCVVLCVRASTWKDGLLSRFTADDKRMEEGKGKAEEALKAMRDAGLTIKVKKHSTKDGSRLLMVFVTAELGRLERQHARLQRERWLQEEGIGESMGAVGGLGQMGPMGRQLGPKPSFINPFLAADGAAGGLQPLPNPSRSAATGGSASASASTSAEPIPSGGAEEAEPSDFRPSAAHRVELLNHILRTPAEEGGAGLEAMQKAMQKADRKHGAILHIFPLQDAHANRALRRRAKRVNPFCGQSLEGFLRDVRAQYGEKVAFYYAFNAHYTYWLVVPSVVGGFLFTLSFFAEQQVPHPPQREP